MPRECKTQGVAVRLYPFGRARKETPFVQTKGVSFQLNPPCRVGEIIFDDEIPYRDEIRLNGGWVDLISSAKQISSERSEDFIVLCTISLKKYRIYDTISS